MPNNKMNSRYRNNRNLRKISTKRNLYDLLRDYFPHHLMKQRERDYFPHQVGMTIGKHKGSLGALSQRSNQSANTSLSSSSVSLTIKSLSVSVIIPLRE